MLKVKLKWAAILALLALLTILAGCTASPENRVQIKVTNTTPMPLTFRAGSSIFATSVTVLPGGSWSGWIDRRFVGSAGWVTVEPFDPLKNYGPRGR
jgi:hypothetical protein